MNGLLPPSRMRSMRAATSGSLGTSNGSLSTMTRDSAAPGTSTPYQNDVVPSNTARGVSLKRSTRAALLPSPWTISGQRSIRLSRSCTRSRLAYEVNRTKARPSVIVASSVISSTIRSTKPGSRGSGMRWGRYNTAWRG